jgi:superkiller protein 3
MIVWLLKEVADRWPKTRVVMAAAAVLVFAALGAITFKQVSYWKNSYVLFEHAAQVTDDNWFAYNHLGIKYDEDGMELLKTDPEAAQERFDRSAENFKKSIDIKPDYDFGHNNLGVYYARPGPSQKLNLAEEYFRRALASNWRYADAYNNLGIVLFQQNKLDESIACHLKGIGVRPDRASDHNNLGRVYAKKYFDDPVKNKDDLENAMRENALARQFDPNFPGAWMSLADIYVQQKNLDDAGKCVQRMAAIDAKARETIQAEFMMAKKQFELKHFDEAIGWCSQILEVARLEVGAYHLRGTAYLQKGDLPRAKQDFEQILRIYPAFPGAQETLNAIRARMASPSK